VKAFALITLCLFLLVGCASHGTWSKSDRGAWANLDELIGAHEQAYYVEQWGEPVSRHHEDKFVDGKGKVTPYEEELLWLWKADGTGPSEQSGQGWEMYLSFGHDRQRSTPSWRIGGYRSTLKVSDVIATTRKFEYRFGQELLGELGLLLEQHGIVSNRQPSNNWRGWSIMELQGTVRLVVEATFRADNAARNLHSRLATYTEINAWLEDQTKAINGSRQRQRPPQESPNYTTSGSGQGGLLGSGFLGPSTPNAYGPGMNADATGRPFIWKPDFGGPALGPIQPNAYGPGVGMDATGRPVRPACPPGWTGPC